MSEPISAFIEVKADITEDFNSMTLEEKASFKTTLANAQGKTNASWTQVPEMTKNGQFIAYRFTVTALENIDDLVTLMDNLYGPPNADVLVALYSEGMYPTNLVRTYNPSTEQYEYTQKLDGQDQPIPDPFPMQNGKWNARKKPGAPDDYPANTPNGPMAAIAYGD